MTTKPTFARWREDLGISIEQAAVLLGLGRGQVCALSRGVDASGRPVLPKTDTRLLMGAVADGIPLRPWALSPEEVDVQRAARRKRIAAQMRSRVTEAA